MAGEGDDDQADRNVAAIFLHGSLVLSFRLISWIWDPHVVSGFLLFVFLSFHAQTCLLSVCKLLGSAIKLMPDHTDQSQWTHRLRLPQCNCVC